jgi:hypothetical protein
MPGTASVEPVLSDEDQQPDSSRRTLLFSVLARRGALNNHLTLGISEGEQALGTIELNTIQSGWSWKATLTTSQRFEFSLHQAGYMAKLHSNGRLVAVARRKGVLTVKELQLSYLGQPYSLLFAPKVPWMKPFTLDTAYTLRDGAGVYVLSFDRRGRQILDTMGRRFSGEQTVYARRDVPVALAAFACMWVTVTLH